MPQLSEQQTKKLKLLSLLPLSRSHDSLTYAFLQSALDLPTASALEELVKSAIYSGLISATLDPAHSLVSVTSVSPLRDLAPGSVPALQHTLQTWSQRCDAALADLEIQVTAVKTAAVEREKQRRKKERSLEATMAALDEKNNNKRGVSGLGDEDIMDIDDNSGGRVTRNSKRGAGTSGFAGFGRRL